MSSEIDDEVEEERSSGPFVYQASISFLQPCQDIILLKAYSREQAEEIIRDSFKNVVDLNIQSLTVSQEQSIKSFLKSTSN